MNQASRVLTTVEGGVAHVRLNRPEKRNGLDEAMFEALVAAGIDLSKRTDVRAVVLSGEGSAFCAGLDFMSFMAAGEAGKERLLGRSHESPANLAQRAAYVWIEVPVPVIAAIRGPAIGGGCQLALAADVRLVAADARFSVMEIKYGLIPDMSITQTLPRLVRFDVASELIYTGRIVAAEEAVAIGLATRLVADPVAEAHALARAIAARSPEAIRAGKRLLREAHGLDPAAALRLETDLQLPLLGSRNQLEAVQAAFAGRPAEFVDPSAPDEDA
ncbi:MAG: crotonase/enoyl-CoA hydratase family protein [Nannocystaceae bacterium]|nr:crotonase/enoyl-CoA hydratase family protein [Myxococcales bacterium]